MNFRKTTPEDVRWAYRLLLEREVESEAAILNKMGTFTHVHEMVQSILASDEYVATKAAFENAK